MPVFTSVPVNQTIFWNKFTFTSTSEKTSHSCLMRGTEGCIFSFKSDVAGTYKIDAKFANEFDQIAEGKIKAGKLYVVDIEFHIPEVRIRFESDSVPAVVTATVNGYPAVITRDGFGNVC